MHSLNWSPDGTFVALACKDKKLRVLAPRNVSSLAEVGAHDSLRSFRVQWLDNEHIASVGFTTGSSRQLKLFKLTNSGGALTLSEVSRLGLDVSPAVLFPHYDPDTNVLFVYSKGERSVSAFEIHLEDKQPFLALPSFQHSQAQLGMAFLNKRHVDVRKVEIAIS